MSGLPARQWLLLATTLLLLAACLPENRTQHRQTLVEWPEKKLLFMADERSGMVQVFYLGNGAPLRIAQSQQLARHSVRDMKIDPDREALWVLGNDTVDVHDPRTLKLRKRIALDARDVAQLQLGHGGILLLASNGELLGHVDPARLIANWQPLRRINAS